MLSWILKVIYSWTAQNNMHKYASHGMNQGWHSTRSSRYVSSSSHDIILPWYIFWHDDDDDDLFYLLLNKSLLNWIELLLNRYSKTYRYLYISVYHFSCSTGHHNEVLSASFNVVLYIECNSWDTEDMTVFYPPQ